MGRYADLKFVTEAEVPDRPGDLVARESWVGRLVVVHQGNTIDAVIVAKDLYGFTTTEAKRFLDELQGR